ncbi:MAG: zinc ABC transporter substrate-binding protein [Lachnospiraceae bacterium]|nr:zinc ABC transporter substrate-binding protein [Lachnospiraceae bacterium]
MKKIYIKLCYTFIMMLTIVTLCACESKNSTIMPNDTSDGNRKIKIVATVFPIYDIVRNLIPDDNYELTLLLDSGIDIHNFSPTAKDIAKLAEADLFIYVGGESDNWVDKTIESSQNNSIIRLNLMESLFYITKEEEVVEGMQSEHEEHGEHEEHDGHDEHEVEMDEHIWLSVKNAKEITKVIANELMKLDDENKTIIESNANNFIQQLDELDRKYTEVTEKKKYDTLLFGDRFPFRYLVDDYGIDYYAAFSGCSAEAEASFETIVFLSKKVDELGLRHVCVLEGKEPKIAETIISSCESKDVDIVYFNSMEGITDVNDALNTNYIKIMEGNLEAYSKALND